MTLSTNDLREQRQTHLDAAKAIVERAKAAGRNDLSTAPNVPCSRDSPRMPVARDGWSPQLLRVSQRG